MKFSKFFTQNQHPAFADRYCQYSTLSEILVLNILGFKEAFDAELTKVFEFVEDFLQQLNCRASVLEQQANGISTKKNSESRSLKVITPQPGNFPEMLSKSTFNTNFVQNSPFESSSNQKIHTITGFSSKNSSFFNNPSLTKKEVKKNIKILKKDMNKLSGFMRLNAVAFNKLLKKHDAKSQYKLAPMYKPKLKIKLREVAELDKLIYKISKITLVADQDKFTKNTMSNNAFIRKTTKYWVHKENLPALKCLILNHLPIYVHTAKQDDKNNNPHNAQSTANNESFDKSQKIQNSNTTLGSLKVTGNKNSDTTLNLDYSKNTLSTQNFTNMSSSLLKRSLLQPSETENKCPYEAWDPKMHDTCISSVYLDNKSFELYHGRLNKHQGAEAIRIRWYGKKIPSTVFIERKRHEEDWTGDESKKLRFKIPENKVNDYLRGKNVWSHVEPLNKENLDDIFVLYNEIQNTVIKKNLQPSVRTFYKRTAFQLPHSSQVRISLDTHLCMIKENTDFSHSENWRRKDVECEFPFLNLKQAEITRFPYAVLEIKLQSFDGEKPAWIEDLIKSDLIEHVDKFSKFMHGTCLLYPTIETIPYWIPQMGTRINDFFCSENEIASETAQEINVDSKRIAIPVRVEPKVFFANERTFLSWLHFSIFIGGIGTAMLGLGDTRAVYSGMVFIGVSVLFAIYALYLYFWRAGMIRVKDPGPYDDLYGPAVLVTVFLAAMVLSVIFKMRLH